MTSIDRVKRLLRQGEGIRIEYKEARNRLPSNIFETICAFLNRDGGDLFLGVDNNGNIVGVDEGNISKLKRDLVNQSNDSNKLNPPFILFPKVVEIRGRTIIHVQVPQSSQIHKTLGIVFDRSEDGDFRVTDPNQIAQMVNRKLSYYTESKIYSEVGLNEFNIELLNKARNLIRSNKPNHPWLALNDEQMLVTAGLCKRDLRSGDEGYTLAAVLLFGKDEVIKNILPHYKIDALVRIENMDRYDDRLIIKTNLLDSYDSLMAFVHKHLPDKFYMEGDQRKSLRDNIFREVVANLIVHREYTNAFPASFEIYHNRVEMENANNPHGSGPIAVDSFTPFPKNPTISKFFMELGRVEELGSGVLNVNRLIKNYAPGKRPQFIEGAVFKTIIPIEKREIKARKVDYEVYQIIRDTINDTLKNAVNEVIRERLVKETTLISKQELNIKDLTSHVKMNEKTIKRDMSLLKKYGIVEYVGSLRKGYYRITNKFKKKMSL